MSAGVCLPSEPVTALHRRANELWRGNAHNSARWVAAIRYLRERSSCGWVLDRKQERRA